MKKLILLILCLSPLHSHNQFSPIQDPEVRLERKLENFNNDLEQLEMLIKYNEVL